VIKTGGEYAFMLSTTPAVGILGGYALATCNFQNAVGYAALVNNAGLGTWDAYSNYLAYVIPTPFIYGRVYDAIFGEFAIQPPYYDDLATVFGAATHPNERAPHNIYAPRTK
jgi:hypothetical protein